MKLASENEFSNDEKYQQKRQEEINKKTSELKEKLSDISADVSLRKLLLKRTVKNNKKIYSEEYKFLDSKIDDIEEKVFQCQPYTKIAEFYRVKGILFAKWMKESIHLERIKIAIEMSSEVRMNLSEDTLTKWIEDPRLTIQQTGLIRELALHHSRMAGFRNQQVFGKKIEIEKPPTVINVVTEDGMSKMIEQIREEKRLRDQRELGQGFDDAEEIEDEIAEEETNEEEDEEFNLDNL